MQFHYFILVFFLVLFSSCSDTEADNYIASIEEKEKILISEYEEESEELGENNTSLVWYDSLMFNENTGEYIGVVYGESSEPFGIDTTFAWEDYLGKEVGQLIEDWEYEYLYNILSFESEILLRLDTKTMMIWVLLYNNENLPPGNYYDGSLIEKKRIVGIEVRPSQGIHKNYGVLSRKRN